LPTRTVYGFFAGRGWEWVTGGYLLGGLFLWWRGIISWHAPLSFIAGLSLWPPDSGWYNPLQFANPLFHLFSGGAMLGAWFIVTDPVSGCTTPRGKLIFGFSAGMLALRHPCLWRLSGRCRLCRAADEHLRPAD
jgi:electron transport complex protein RnfD